MKTKLYAGLIVALSILALFSTVGLVSASSDVGNSNLNDSFTHRSAGAVYTIDNAATGNMVIRYDRASNGVLTWSGNFAANGLGTGSKLASQGAVILTENGRWLLVVDAGSNEISVFSVSGSGLFLTDVVGCGGIMPVSLTIHNNIVYVLNAGGTPNIAGFRLTYNGMLTFIAGSVQPLSGIANNQPEQIGFNTNGKVLVVAEVGANIIDTYTLNRSGQASAPMTHASNSPAPYGFAFDGGGNLIISEAANGTLSSYIVNNNGSLKLISGSVPDFGVAPCWVVVTASGQVYTSNAHGGTISGYNAIKHGNLVLFSSVAATVNIPSLDLALSNGDHFLYNLNGGSITGFWIGSHGSLTQVTMVSELAESTTGLAAS